MKFQEWLESEDLLEYDRRAPVGNAIAEDVAICNECTCSECGHTGLNYEPFTRRDRYGNVSYRAFTVCPVCDDANEF